MNFYDLDRLYESRADQKKIFAAMEEMGLNATEEQNQHSFAHGCKVCRCGYNEKAA